MRLVESPYNSIRIMEGVDRARDGRAVRLMATDPGYSQSGMLLDAPDELYSTIPFLRPGAAPCAGRAQGA